MHGCALTTTGPMCWGYNSFGQTGDGTSNNSRYEPVAVVGLGNNGAQRRPAATPERPATQSD